MFCSNVLFGEFVLRNLGASPLTKPFFAPGVLHVVTENEYWNGSAGLKCVLISRTDSLLNLWPLLYMVVSKKVESVHDISAINLIAGW